MLIPQKNLSLLGFLITISFLTSPTIVANASLRQAYNPPPPDRRIAQRRTLGSGSRSNCPNSWAEGSLTLFIPETEVIHQTASNRPTFYVHAQNSSPTPLTFNLVSPDDYSGIPLVEKSLVIEKGINKITLPEKVELETDKVYLWQIGVPCNSLDEFNDEDRLNASREAPIGSTRPQTFTQVIRGAVKRVNLSTSVKKELETANSPLEKAQIYANRGIWYDALNSAYKEPNYFEQLLQEADINIDR